MKVAMVKRRAGPKPEIRVESPGRSIIIKSGREKASRRAEDASRPAKPAP